MRRQRWRRMSPVLTTTDYPSAPDITRTYDPNGNLLTLNRGGANWTYTYNALDLVESESLSIDGRTYLIDEGYDYSGALTSKQYPSGRLYSFAIDGYGRPIQLGVGSGIYLSGISYHANGKINTLYHGGGSVYQQNLNTRQLVEYVGDNSGIGLSYLYDAAGRITSIDSPNNSYDRGFTYDGAGRLKTASGPWGSGYYYYDKLSNLTQRVEGSRVVDVAMDTLSNHVNSVRDTATSSVWRSYGYDGRGNVTSDGLHSFVYDDANQPTSISGPDSGSYAYDGNYRRVKQVVNGKTIYSIYDKSGVILTRDDTTAGSTTDYLTLQGQTFMRMTNGIPWFPLNDHLGSAYMVADWSGGVTAANTYNFTPFGEAIGNDPGTKNEQGYTGHIEDSTGLTYMQARYYDPVIGRFLSADPIGYADQLNLYAYVRNDPLNRTDPTGNMGELVATGCAITAEVGCAPGAAVGAILEGVIWGGTALYAAWKGAQLYNEATKPTETPASTSADKPKDKPKTDDLPNNTDNPEDAQEDVGAAQDASRVKRPSIADADSDWEGAKSRPKSNDIESTKKSDDRARDYRRRGYQETQEEDGADDLDDVSENHR